MTDAAVVARARSGDESALRALYDAHVDRVYRVAFRLTGEEELAREFTQDAFVLAFQKLDQFRGDARFSTWLHVIATRSVYNGMRSVQRLRQREVELEAVPNVVARRPNRPEPGLRERLHEAIDALPPIYRAVFVMYDVEGYTHPEIARTLEVAVGTSKARLHHARSLLRDALVDYVEEYT